ncbi:MAG: GntR family transcriptional regulator [Rhodospirillales bacterium]|nr:GntR family transcriptional regulator [Rhodospirillales bacterium]
MTELQTGGFPEEGLRFDAPSRLNELVFKILRDHIVDGAFENGLVLRENAVAEAFGVGRAPVRMALRRLEEEFLVSKRAGHGFQVSRGGTPKQSLHVPLAKAGLIVPPELNERLNKRNRRQHIYPTVERAVAACLTLGRFRINQSALAEHFGVSRTVAHEVLTGLERVGFVRQGRNARWYAGRLTVEDLRESYELRWLLEPVALLQAAPGLSRKRLTEARDQILRAQQKDLPDPEDLNDIEMALHTGIVLDCTNRQMRTVLRNCQLPIIVTYGTVVRRADTSRHKSGIPETLAEHLAIIDLLLDGRSEAASKALEAHIRHGSEMSLPHFVDAPAVATDSIPPYLILEPEN